ncbi:NADAR family protein [Polyangium sp. 15x6]|uniref:NADAR family protein n=1 Tax=Polyangium sp. 15x6 TaxID=3042687 RepID=UPI00249C2874|nr:NADAR family protein [Polyangium sp. 15x6]MDI3290768.1 NADAR family protein [Polyangium sp. 15x6]
MDVATLIARQDRGETLDYLFFWGHTPGTDGALGPFCLSQWYPAPFEVRGQRYVAAEHFMMAEKARLFGDEATRAKILATEDPGEAKALGREVRDFDEARWREHRFGIVVEASFAKFGQNPALGEWLLRTGSKILVEASPRDTIWGIGLGASNPSATDPRAWRGLNLLGFALMEAREGLAGAARPR